MSKKTNNNTAELEDKIKNYGKEIKHLSDFVEKVRKTPDVYIGKVRGNTAFLTMVREIFQNSVDEILKGNAFSPVINVTYDERSHWVIVEDNARGIPHGQIGLIFGTDHTSSNYEKKPYCYSAGKNGCGGSVTNALSSKFLVDSFQLGKGKHAEFIEGHLWEKGEVDIDANGRQGTVISFVPNEQEIGQVTSTWKDVYDLLAMITPSAPIGTTVEYVGVDSKGKQHVESIVNQDGIMTYLIKLTQSPFIAPVICEKDNGTMKVVLAFTYEAGSEESIISLNNTCPTEGGTHVEGAIDGICKFFRNYMNKIYLKNIKSKQKYVANNNDIQAGLKLAVSTFHLYGLYNGQAKEFLDNEDITPFVSEAVQEALNEWVKTHPNDLQKLCRYFKDVIDLRLKSDKDKVKLSNKFSSSLTGLPAKYIKPNGRHDTELIIVEGDSAFGSARNIRDQARQGIFPIRGKMPNVFVKSKKEILENEEASGILTIIGAGYGKNFDMNKCRVSKVIIMADADPDGAHIRTLVLRFLAMYCKPLVQAGMVYAALPPLYGIPEGRGKNKYRFFTDKLDFIKYVQNQFTRTNTIGDAKGKLLTNKEVLSLLYKNSDYTASLEHVAATYAIDPLLLEFILQNRDLSYAKFANAIKKRYRFMDIEKDAKSGIIILKGLANDKYHEVFVNQQLFNECTEIINFIDGSPKEFTLNGSKASLYQIMKEFNSFIPPKLSRFKGLGEMDAKMLGPSTLRPDGDRLLVRYTFEDVEKELEYMRYINSNKDMLLSDIENS